MEYKYGHWREDAESKEWRKYFRARDRGRAGSEGDSFREFRVDEFVKYELTTREGDDNTYKRMANDHKVLLHYLRKKGYKLSYIACTELSPNKGLMHLHGMFRGVKLPDHALLKDIWSRLHNAPIVWIQSCWDKDNVVDYAVKHVVKQYPETSRNGQRLMLAKDWMPKNYQVVKKLLNAAALKMIMDGIGSKQVWERVNEVFYRWCRGLQTPPFEYKGNTHWIKNQAVTINGITSDLKGYGEYLKKGALV